MKKNVNSALLIGILILVGVFVGFSVFYQTSLKNITTEYTDKIDKLDQVEQDLLAHKTILEETEYELEVKAGQEEDLSSKFGNVQGERDELATDKTRLELEVKNIKAELVELNAELVQTKFTLSSTLKDLTKVEDKLRAEKSGYDNCRDSLEDCLNT